MRSPRRVAVESTSGRFSERNDNCEVFRQALSECCLQSLWVCVNRRASRSRRRPSLDRRESHPSRPSAVGMCPPSTVSSSDSAVLLAAAAVAPSGRSIACGIFVAAVSQLGWGCYPVFARALQTQEPKLTIVELLVAVNGITATVLAASALAGWLLRQLLRLLCPGSVAPAVKASGACTLSWRHVRLVVFFGAVIAVRAVTNIASAAYAPAHWCGMTRALHTAATLL
jgi:hypothetical protein